MTEPNAADRKWIREREKSAKLLDLANQSVVVSLMSTPDGRRYIWDKLELAHIFSTTFSTDALQMAFNEGQRNQGLQLLADIIRWCPDQYIQAMRESNARRDTDNASTRNTGQRAGREDADGRDQGPAGDAAGDGAGDEDSRDEAA